MVPAELANLNMCAVNEGPSSAERKVAHLVIARTRLEVEIGYVHLLKAERAFRILLSRSSKQISIYAHIHNAGGIHTASSSLQYASCTPARTCDLDCGSAWVACNAGAGRGELV